MIIPDANLLLYAYDSHSPFHRPAKRWLTDLLSGYEPVGLCAPVLFSFIRLATHPKVFAHPMSAAEATEVVQSWLSRPNTRMLYPGPSHFEIVCRLLGASGTAGNLVSDAQIAALAQEFNATVHSADTDFARFKGITWVNPLES